MNEVSKYGAAIPVSQELLVEVSPFPTDFGDRMRRVLDATPEQRAEWARQAAEREATEAAQRAEERAGTPAVEPTMDGLLAKLGWGPEYARHVVQPYCECEDDMEGWRTCKHAQDLGLEVWQ